MTTLDALIITIAIVIVLSIVLLSGTIILLDTMKKEKVDLEREKFYESIDIESKKKILINLITEEMDIYKIKNILFNEYPYLKDNDIKEMITRVTANTIKRLTPTIMTNISYAYNISTDEELITTIGDITSMMVMEYASKLNIPN